MSSSDAAGMPTPPPMDIPVSVPITAVITRFGLRGRRHLRPTVRDYERLASSIKSPEEIGLLRWAFMVENPTTCFSLSIWASEQPRMSSNVPRHIDVANRVFSRLAYEPGRGPELWSTQWRLVSTSHNVNWGEFGSVLQPTGGAGSADAR